MSDRQMVMINFMYVMNTVYLWNTAIISFIMKHDTRRSWFILNGLNIGILVTRIPEEGTHLREKSPIFAVKVVIIDDMCL